MPGSKPTERFKTEIPTFADTDALSRLLQAKEGRRQRQAARDGPVLVGEPARRVRSDAPLHRADSWEVTFNDVIEVEIDIL